LLFDIMLHVYACSLSLHQGEDFIFMVLIWSMDSDRSSYIGQSSK
jgi:hypothetical protein